MQDDDFLQKAMDLGQQSPDAQSCGVMIVRGGEVLVATYNMSHAEGQAAYPAEIKAVVEVHRQHASEELEGAVAYCSCTPCRACFEALSSARIPRIIGVGEQD